MDRNLILAILSNLNSIEVRGEENMNKLLGCIQALRRLLTEEDKNNG